MAQLLTVKQVAGQLGVSRSTVYKMLEGRVLAAAPIRLPSGDPRWPAGSSTNRSILADATEIAHLDVLLKEAGVETRREAVRLHELMYGTEPGATDADLYPIERYGRRPDWDTRPRQ